MFSYSDPPHIKGSGAPAEVTVVVNNVLELQCEVSGIPTPFLTWLKDGRPLPQTESLSLLRGGEVLHVASAQVSDMGLIHISFIFDIFLLFIQKHLTINTAIWGQVIFRGILSHVNH